MLNIRTDIPIKENVIETTQNILAQVRDLTLEIEQVLKMAIEDDVLLLKEEVAQRLHCDKAKIPRSIPKMRVGKNTLYSLKDLNAFLQSKKR